MVVGAGITGLAAAWELCGASAAGQGLRVVVVEATERVGGCLRTTPFAGVPLDEGPDSFVSRAPEALELCKELDLADELVTPATNTAFVWARGRLRRFPDGLVLGVPTKLAPLVGSGVLSPRGVLRALAEPILPRGRHPDRADDDVAVAELVRARFGSEVDSSLVDPIIGGINAGSTGSLSLAAVAPQLDRARREHRSLSLGLTPEPARDRSAGPSDARASAFLSLEPGLGTLADELARRLREAGVELLTSVEVESVDTADTSAPGGGGGGLSGVGPGGTAPGEGGLGGARAGAARWVLSSSRGRIDADAVVVATPAPAAARQLRRSAPAVSTELSAVEYSSVAVVALCFEDGAIRSSLDGSGFLVPRTAGKLMTACTWTSSKWAHLKPPGRTIIRASAGRDGQDEALQLDDAELAGRLCSELGQMIEIDGRPVETRVSRWPRSFPQYKVGHLSRVSRIEDEAASIDGLAVAGAALRGLGIPACIAQGRRAARSVLEDLSRERRA